MCRAATCRSAVSSPLHPYRSSRCVFADKSVRRIILVLMAPAAHDDSRLGDVIQAYMRTHGVATHQEMASILGVDRTLVSKYVSGSRQCHDVVQLRRFAEAMDLPPETFGVLRAGTSNPEFTREVDEWRVVRQTLNRNRSALTSIAAKLYWKPLRIEGTSCITQPGWMTPAPIDLDSIALDWRSDAIAPLLNGGEPESAAYRPVREAGSRFGRYSQAMRAIARPSLFENRTSYRLLDLVFDDHSGRMSFGSTTYFDMVDVCEVLAHEVAAAWIRRRDVGGNVGMVDLPYRDLVGDLFDLSRRPVLPSINTLTIRRAPEGDSFFLHRRGAGRVTLAAGQSHVIPAGVFQPAAIGHINVARDFDLWRNMLREFSEEFLDEPEHDGSSGVPVDYDAEPLRTLNQGKQDGKIKAWCFGVGLDPLAPAGEILTTVVIDSEVFDAAFRRMVARNAEGEMHPADEGSVGIAWTSSNVRHALTREPLACAAAACLSLTWKHRARLLPT